MAPHRSRIHHPSTSSSRHHHSPATDATPSDILSMARTDSTFPSVYGRSPSHITTTCRYLSHLFLPGCRISRPSLYPICLRSLSSYCTLAQHKRSPPLSGLCPLPRRLPTLRRKHGLISADSCNFSSLTWASHWCTLCAYHRHRRPGYPMRHKDPGVRREAKVFSVMCKNWWNERSMYRVEYGPCCAISGGILLKARASTNGVLCKI